MGRECLGKFVHGGEIVVATFGFEDLPQIAEDACQPLGVGCWGEQFGRAGKFPLRHLFQPNERLFRREHLPAEEGIDDHSMAIALHTNHEVPGSIQSFDRESGTFADQLVDEGEKDGNAAAGVQHGRQVAVEGVVIAGHVALEAFFFKQHRVEIGQDGGRPPAGGPLEDPHTQDGQALFDPPDIDIVEGVQRDGDGRPHQAGGGVEDRQLLLEEFQDLGAAEGVGLAGSRNGVRHKRFSTVGRCGEGTFQAEQRGPCGRQGGCAARPL